MKCKDCRHWRRVDRIDRDLHVLTENYGRCHSPKIGDPYAYPATDDLCVVKDFPMYDDTHEPKVFVGADFGCVNFEPRGR